MRASSRLCCTSCCALCCAACCASHRGAQRHPLAPEEGGLHLRLHRRRARGAARPLGGVLRAHRLGRRLAQALHLAPGEDGALAVGGGPPARNRNLEKLICLLQLLLSGGVTTFSFSRASPRMNPYLPGPRSTCGIPSRMLSVSVGLGSRAHAGLSEASSLDGKRGSSPHPNHSKSQHKACFPARNTPGTAPLRIRAPWLHPSLPQRYSCPCNATQRCSEPPPVTHAGACRACDHRQSPSRCARKSPRVPRGTAPACPPPPWSGAGRARSRRARFPEQTCPAGPVVRRGRRGRG